MSAVNLIESLSSAGREAFRQGDCLKAAQLFKEAGDLYLADGDKASAAEMANNRSVALLKTGDARNALQVVEGTDDIFAKAGDPKRQGMALGNQAAALEALGKYSEAEAKYEQSAEILENAGEKELCGITLQSLSALKLRHRDHFGALITMQSALSSKKKLSAPEMLLKRLLKIVTGLLNR